MLSCTGCPGPQLEGVENIPGGDYDHPDFSLFFNSRVDVLFVVDNSWSMGEEQAALVAGFDAFADVLTRPGVDADLRIGITTTDNGNPWCSGTTPEAGSFQLRSCRDRLEEFVFEGAETIDVTELACTAVCPAQWTEIEIVPTEVPQDSEVRPRPWIESVEGRTNLPEGLSLAQAFRCLAPQGIAGCGLESPLESMWKALQRSQTSGEPEFGFVRHSAILSVIHVTDEADCSYNSEWETIFQPDGGRVFWSDPDAPVPSSAVCWNAGVACEGLGTYDDCRPVDHDVDGNELPRDDANELAVLRPVSRYVDYLQEIEDFKQESTPDQEVLVSVIGGVAADGSVVYQDTGAEPEFLRDFGIGPGCSSTSGSAVPPVRLRALADELRVGDQRNLFSVCEWNYAPALSAVAEAIAAQIRPACIPACVADDDPETEVLDPDCRVVFKTPRGDGSFETGTLMECADGVIPDGEDVCYRVMVGDQLAEFCAELGLNLEVQIVGRDGMPEGTSYKAICDLSEDKAVDCPDLP